MSVSAPTDVVAQLNGRLERGELALTFEPGGRGYLKAVLAALGCVDWVTWFGDDTPLALILAARPDVLVKGGDWPVEAIVGGGDGPKASGAMRTVLDPGAHRVDPLAIGVELVAVVDRDRVGEVAGRVLAGFVGDDDDLRDPFGGDLARDVLRRERAVERLAAGHRDGVVVEDLVGDVDARGDRGADR